MPAEESDTSVEFQNETNAYAQLIQYGLTAKRMVPSCYGIIDIPEWPSPQLTGKDISYHFNSDHGPPKAILLEYLADMKTVGLKNLSESVAEETLRIVTCIHEAYVIHRDCVARNIMVDGDGRVMIVRAFYQLEPVYTEALRIRSTSATRRFTLRARTVSRPSCKQSISGYGDTSTKHM